MEMLRPAFNELGASIFWVNAETSVADTEDLLIGWQTGVTCDGVALWR
jgi:hypothetical protein